ncbi:MAG: hypothetical protein J6Y52_03600 [Bacteroidales bacterium]|nr:hypothetical protein [Bacteroidales bacterium]
MKKRILFVAMMAGLVSLVSCHKEDMNLLSKPYRVQGEIDPGFSLPMVSNGQLNLNDLLKTFDGTFSGLILEDNVITFHYDTTLNQRLQMNPSSSKKGVAAGRKPMVKNAWTKSPSDSLIRLIDTVIRYEIPVDIFDKVENIDMQIAHMMLALKVKVRGGCPDEAANNYLRENASISLDRLKIQYFKPNETDTTDFDGNAQLADSLIINDIVAGDSVSFVDVNLASIINDRPKKIVASCHMNFNVKNSIYDSIMADPLHADRFTPLLEALQMSWLQYDANLDLRLPFEVKINNMTFDYSIDVNQTAQNGNNSQSLGEMVNQIKQKLNNNHITLSFDTLNRFVFEFNNGIPLNILLNATFRDENDQQIGTLFNNGMIDAAYTEAVPGNPGVSEASAPRMSRIFVPFDTDMLNQLLAAKTIKLDMALSTNGTDKMSIQRDDYLNIKMKIQLHPSLSVDMPLFNSNN